MYLILVQDKNIILNYKLEIIPTTIILFQLIIPTS